MTIDLGALLPDPDARTQRAGRWVWGTVTQAAPLRVRLDGDTTALDLTPDALTPGHPVGQRVLCQIRGGRVIVHGTPDWQDYTPTLTNVTIGDGTVVARYQQVGKTVHFWVFITSGSGTSLTGTVQIGLPVPAVLAQAVIGAGFRSSPFGALVFRGSASTRVFVYDAATGTAWDAGTEFSAGDTLRISGTYEAA